MDLRLHNPITKRQRLLEEPRICDTEDRISNLPDAVISHMLSFLPTKYAVGTTILSKRWNCLWTSVPNLDFDASLMFHYFHHKNFANSDDNVKCFMDFVDRVLSFHDGMSIEKFRLKCSRVCANSRFYTWVSAVVVSHVKELQLTSTAFRHIDMPLTEFWQIDIPWSLFTCKTLVILKLTGGFVLNIPTHVSLPVLKILHLNSVTYADDISIQKLISGCPALEDLDIERYEWDGVRVINIYAPSLKRLSIQFFLYAYFGSCAYKIVVGAPNLVYLKLADNRTVEYSVDNVPSVVEAQIGVYNYSRPASLELVGRVARVRALQLSGKIMEVILSAENYDLPVFHNLTRLELGANKEVGWELLADLLESTPNLEALVFPRGLVKRFRSLKKPYFEFEWDPPEWVPGCLLSRLETIIIYEFLGTNCEVDLVEYLLKNAKIRIKCRCYCKECCKLNLAFCACPSFPNNAVTAVFILTNFFLIGIPHKMIVQLWAETLVESLDSNFAENQC